MSLPSQSRISFARINENVRFTGGNFGINTTNPTSTLDVSGTARITTSITSEAVYATNSTVTNSVSTNISSGTLNLSTGITSASAQMANLVSTNSTMTNLRSTLSSIGTLRTDLGVMTEGLMVKASIYTSLTVPNLLVTTSVSSGAVYATNSTVTNAVSTNISSGTLNLSTGLTAGTILATTSISSGEVNATNSTVTNLYSLNSTLSNLRSTLSSIGTLRTDLGVMTEGLMTKASISTSLTVPNLLVTTSVSSGAVYATNSTVTNSVVTSNTVGTSIITTSLLAIGNSNTVGNIFTTGGNVGIGTSAPGSYKLHVVGDINYTGSLYQNGAIFNGSSQWLNNGSNIYFSTGNVGIGTSNPSYKLDVNAGATTNGNLMMSNTVGGGVIVFQDIHHSIWGRRGYNGNTDTMQFREYGQVEFWTGGLIGSQTQRMIITSTGDVGIGTGSPTAKLNVSGTTDLFGNVRVGGNSSSTAFNIDLGTTGAGGSRAGYLYGDGTTMYLTNQQNGGINFGTNNTWDRMVVTAAGDVGVGTASPGYKLDVNGSFATNTMLIRSTSYSTTLANQVYNGNTWYTAIAPGILTSDATYIVSLSFGCDGTPWNIYASFLHMIGYTNDNQSLSTSGANVPTTIHANNSNGVDYQIKVRGSYAPNSSGGIQFSVNGTTPSGSWTVKAYRIV